MTNPSEKTERPVEELSFEEALEELEALTTREITLRESVAGYERGRALLDHCQAELNRAQEVIERLRPKTSAN